MSTTEIRRIRGELLAQGHTFASIAAELDVHASHVSKTVSGRSTSARVRKAIAEKLGRDPWANDTQQHSAVA